MVKIPMTKVAVSYVLAWFVLSIGISIAAPWVQNYSRDVVCSATDIDSSAPTGSHAHGIDCPLCLSGIAPTPVWDPLRGRTTRLPEMLPRFEAEQIRTVLVEARAPRGPPPGMPV